MRTAKKHFKTGTHSLFCALVFWMIRCSEELTRTDESTHATENTKSTGDLVSTTMMATFSTEGCESSEMNDKERICGHVAGRNFCYAMIRSEPIDGMARIAEVFDIDFDGRDEVVIQQNSPDKTWVLRGEEAPCEGLRIVEGSVLTTRPVLSVTAFDLNHNGTVDFLVRALDGDIGMRTLLFVGDGYGFVENPVAAINFGTAETIADVNGDGHDDVIGRAGGVQIFMGNSMGLFVEAPISPIDLKGEITMRPGVVDFNSDGMLDIIAQRAVYVDGFETVQEGVVLFGDSEYKFTDRMVFGLSAASYPVDVVIADFDRDSNPDIAVSGGVYYGDGVGGIAVSEQVDLSFNISGVDLDNDGLLDLSSSFDFFINQNGYFESGLEGLELPPDNRPVNFNGDDLPDFVAVDSGKGSTKDEIILYIGVAP